MKKIGFALGVLAVFFTGYLYGRSTNKPDYATTDYEQAALQLRECEATSDKLRYKWCSLEAPTADECKLKDGTAVVH